jgi:hypothetical protein
VLEQSEKLTTEPRPLVCRLPALAGRGWRKTVIESTIAGRSTPAGRNKKHGEGPVRAATGRAAPVLRTGGVRPLHWGLFQRELICPW